LEQPDAFEITGKAIKDIVIIPFSQTQRLGNGISRSESNFGMDS